MAFLGETSLVKNGSSTRDNGIRGSLQVPLRHQNYRGTGSAIDSITAFVEEP